MVEGGGPTAWLDGAMSAVMASTGMGGGGLAGIPMGGKIGVKVGWDRYSWVSFVGRKGKNSGDR